MPPQMFRMACANIGAVGTTRIFAAPRTLSPCSIESVITSDFITEFVTRSTAGTLCKAAETLIEAGAVEVHSYITHGVLSGPAVERVQNSVMKSLVITDSIEATEKVKAAKNIRIVPTAPMFAQAILNIWGGMSVSSLFETDTLVPIYEGLYPALPGRVAVPA